MYTRPDASQPGSNRHSAARRNAQDSADDVSHAQMAAAITAGQAHTLSRTITDFVKYRGSWWIFDRDGWIQIDDPALALDLDAAARLMAAAEGSVCGGFEPLRAVTRGR